VGKLAADILWGAGAIASELFGSDTNSARRKVYHLAARGALPVVKAGGSLVARRSQLQQTFRVQVNQTTEKEAASSS
jgi:hypothetical protein